MLSLSDFVSIDSQHIWLPLETAKQEEAWQLAQHQSNAIAIYNAYLNRVCLSHLLSWFQEWLREEATLQPEIFPSQEELPSFLEIVHGTAIKVGETRIVLVPTETLDIEELRVPREWVDIHSWAANCYISVQVNLDGDDGDSWMRVGGFVTHHQLKNQGTYNQSDRTYSLPIEQLSDNFTLLFATLGLRLQAEIPSEVTLSPTEAQDLLQTLRDTSIYSPRLLDIPFEKWAALISHEQWRQQLYNQRINKEQNTVASTKSVATTPTDSPLIQVNLSQWFQKVFATGWQSINDSLAPNIGSLALDFRSSSTNKKVGVHGIKLIDLGMQLGGKSLALMVALSQEEEEKSGVLVQVHPTGNEKYLPPNLKLILLESERILQEVPSRSRDCYIQLNYFKGLPGTKFAVRLNLDEFTITEHFVI
ncbi:hypothetical protein NUACC21_71250 [Scytonema sp. NUACC21]